MYGTGTSMGGLAIVLGAGASHDCHDPRGFSNDDYRPPLVKDLFASRPRFNQVLAKYELAARVAPDLRDRLSAKESIEDILAEYFAPSVSPHLRRMYWEIPLYLQELFGTISEDYAGGFGTLYDTLVQRIERAGLQNVVYITVNYDRFIDRALQGVYGCGFNSLDVHCGQKNWMLAKLHGSVDWGQKLNNYKAPAAPASFDIEGNALDLGPIQYMKGHTQPARGDARTGVYLYPAISTPTSGKQRFTCPDGHVETLKRRLRDCSSLLVIGFSGLDDHVLSLLAEHMPAPKLLAIVNGGMTPGRETFGRLSRHYRSAHDIPEDVVRDAGFSSFVQNGLTAFLSAAKSTT